MRRLVTALLIAMLSGAAHAESFEQRLKRANAQLKNGDAEGALSAYRDLQMDDPESPLLHYSIGCAQYKQGEGETGAPSPEPAIEAFKAAKESFEKATLSPDSQVRLQAAYNRANSAAQLAKLSTSAADHEAAAKAFEESITQYEGFLQQYPEHPAARNNLDHMRYLLKKILQNPPPPQEQNQEPGEQKEQDQQKQDQNQEGDQQQQGQQEQSQQSEQESEQQKQEEGQASQEEQEQEESADQQKEKQDQQQQQMAGAEGEDTPQPPSGEPQNGTSAAPPRDRQAIEAILDSLEAEDNREQRDQRDGRNVRPDTRMRRDWW